MILSICGTSLINFFSTMYCSKRVGDVDPDVVFNLHSSSHHSHHGLGHCQDRVQKAHKWTERGCQWRFYMLTSELTVHMLKCMVRGRVCCPLIHNSPFHFISYSCLLRYSWVSPRLIEDKSYQWLVQPTPKLYIPLEIPEGQDWRQAEWKEKLIVGHSIGYDRSFIKEQYYIKV